MKVKRFDIQEMKGAVRTPQGFLKAPVYATRVGVLKYRKSDGSILRELRHPDEVFHPESMATLEGVPITNNHPREMVDSANARAYTVGWTGETVKKEDKFLKGLATITDRETISDIEKGKTQVSCGYSCELDFTPGTFDGEEYDAVQRGIVYNHLAVVDRGRAGPQVKIHLDSDDAVIDGPDWESCVEQVKQKSPDVNAESVCTASVGKDKQGGTQMMKVMLGGKEFEVSPELHAALMAHMEEMKKPAADADAKAAEAAKMAEEEKKKAEGAQAKADALEAEIKGLKEKNTDEKVRDLVKARVALIASATKAHEGELPKFDDMTDREVKEAVIKSRCPGVELKDRSDEYISARFDAVCEIQSETAGKYAGVGAGKTPDPKDAKPKDSGEARVKMIQKSKDAWKEPLSVTKA